MQENCPFVPRVVQCLPQLVDVGQDAEPALGVGVRVGIGLGGRGRRRLGLFADGQLEQRFLRLLRQMRDDIEQRVLGRLANVIDPWPAAGFVDSGLS